MMGHTHEDVDQSFSCLSRYLRKHDALTMPGKQIVLATGASVFDHFTLSQKWMQH